MFENKIVREYQRSRKILCIYQNKSTSLQIIKIENVTNFYWKKIVFPGQAFYLIR